VRTVLRLG